MAYEPQSQEEYAQAMLAFAASDAAVLQELLPTDLAVGSLERAHVESLGYLLEEGDYRVIAAIKRAVSESCFNAFGFAYLPPQTSVGGIVAASFSPAEEDIPIPTGWQIMGNKGVAYRTTAPGLIAAGDLASDTIPVIALSPGVIGDTPADTITVPVSPIRGVDVVTNPLPTVGGADTETEDARALRFAAFLKTIVRGTTDALEFAALSASAAIIAARAIEPFMLNPVPDGVPFAGLVWLFVDDGTDTPLAPTDGLYLAIKQLVEGFTDISGARVPGYKAAGSKVDILKITRVHVFLRGDISLSPAGVGRWTDVQVNLSAAAQLYFSQLRIGDPVSYQNLVTVLTDSDPDIQQVALYQWEEAAQIPSYGSPISGDPIAFTGYSIGARGVLFAGSAPGPSGTNVTYPEWRLV